jgi:Lipase (class 3)
MAFAQRYDSAEAQLTMTLCEFSYIDESPQADETVQAQAARMRTDINAALSASPYPQWQVAWGPGLSDDRSNMMYVAGSTAAGEYAVIIRGTDWSFVLDWLEDIGVFLGLVPYPYAADTGIKIAAGTAVGLRVLTGLNGTTSGGGQMDLLTFLKSTASNSGVFVTGHSLGGCLASVVAPWLATTPGTAGRLKVYTFAAPSAGNSSFAAYFNGLFWDAVTNTSTAFRVYNTLDVVPNAWATLNTIKTYYDPFPPCTQDIKQLIDDVQAVLANAYMQVGTGAQQSIIPLPGHLVFGTTASVGIDPIGDLLFLYEAGQQHIGATYLKMLGATPVMAASAKLRGVLRSRRWPPKN